MAFSMGGPGGMPMDEATMRNFKEFLETYNKISETCFQRCVVSLNERGLSKEEGDCCDNCTAKNININHKVLSAFMVEQPKITEQKIQRAEQEADAALRKMEAEGIAGEKVSPEEMAQRMMSGMKTRVPNPSSDNS